ncbi:MAG: hypothetical protein HOE86_03085, partial [Gemmatimonadetes bacterium]|nr:hypothetical protein [Gemmatimonadota bacterium]
MPELPTSPNENQTPRRHLAAERVRAAAMEMRASGDLLQVAAVLYREMLNLGILTIAVTIEFFGAAEDPDHLLAYTVYPNPRRIGIGWT